MGRSNNTFSYNSFYCSCHRKPSFEGFVRRLKISMKGRKESEIMFKIIAAWLHIGKGSKIRVKLSSVDLHRCQNSHTTSRRMASSPEIVHPHRTDFARIVLMEPSRGATHERNPFAKYNRNSNLSIHFIHVGSRSLIVSLSRPRQGFP